MVFEAMSLNEITEEMSVDRKEKSRDWALGHSNINIWGDEEEPLSCLCHLSLSPIHTIFSLSWLCLSDQLAYSWHFSGRDFCWPVLSCGHPSLALTDQFQDCPQALETVLASPCPHSPLESFEIHLALSGLTPLPKYRVGIRQMAHDFQSEQCLSQNPYHLWWYLPGWVLWTGI